VEGRIEEEENPRRQAEACATWAYPKFGHCKLLHRVVGIFLGHDLRLPSLSVRNLGEGLELESLGPVLFTGTQKTSSSTYLFFSSDGEGGGLPASEIADEILERIFLNIFCVPPIAGRGVRFG
jgi:hypothetical protein